MSTDLYGVRILEKDSHLKKIKVRVFVVYYDVAYKEHQPLPQDKTFFFRILRDSPFYDRDKKMLLEKIVSLKNYLNEEWVNNNAYKFIDKVEQISTKNYPITNWKGYHDFYYERDGKWTDENKLVQADYEVYVSDEVYIHHLEVGDSWGTTSYETAGIKANIKHQDIIPNLSNYFKKLSPFFPGKQESSTTNMCRFSPDGKYLFAISQNNEIVTYNTEQWYVLWRKKVEGMFGHLYIVDNMLVVNDSGQNTYLDMATGNILAEKEAYIKSSSTNKYNIDFRHESEQAVLRNNKEEAVLSFEFEEEINIVEFSHDEKYLAIGTDEKLEIWDIENQKILQTILSDNNIYHDSVSFDASNTFLVYNNLYIVNIHTGENLLEYTQKENTLPMLNNGVYSPNNKYFALDYILTQYGYDSCLYIYNLADNALSKEAIKLAEIKAEFAANNISDF